jgi:conjugal transfer pilus assembly protein TraB
MAGPAATGAGAEGSERSNAVKLISFNSDGNGTGSRIAAGKSTQYTDSINYLPPNSIATARVIVGVDANTNTRGQADPLPVVLRITGAARSVYAKGKLLRTDIIGCMVNGAAQADLSSEKVYVKLQRMTCPQPGGRVAVSEVKGFIAFGGKTGVRGRVVSRTGNLVGQAMIAGVLGGFGRGFSANAQSALTAPTVNIGGQRSSLSPSQLAAGGLGEGVASSADMVSKYLIERAEQYQPVVEMPTGLDVEVVFLDGVFVRN